MKNFNHPWLNGWRGFVIGSVLALIVTLLVFGALGDRADGAAMQRATAEPASTQRLHCSDDYTCSSPRQHKAAYERGRYGKARQKLGYPKIAKRRILRTAERQWNRRSARTVSSSGPFNRADQWGTFTNRDRCFAQGYPTNMTFCNRPGFMREPDWWAKRRIRVAYCGASMIPAIFTGGTWLWIGYGASACYWGFSVD